MNIDILLKTEGISLDDILEAVANENAVHYEMRNPNTGIIENHCYHLELNVKDGLLGRRTKTISFDKDYIDYNEALNIVQQYNLLKASK